MIGLLFLFSTKPELDTISPVIKKLLTRVDLNRHKIFAVSDAKERIIREFLQEFPNIPLIRLKFLQKRQRIREFFETNKIKIIVSAHEGSPLFYIFSDVAKDMDVPIIYIPHGVLGWGERRNRHTMIKTFLINLHHIRTIFFSGISPRVLGIFAYKFLTERYSVPLWDIICAYGPSMKRDLLNNRIPEDKIKITGQPRFDMLQRLNTSKNTVSSKIRMSKNVLVATQPFVKDGIWSNEEHKKFIHTIIEVAERLPNIRFILKTHPRENEERYQELVQKSNNKNVILAGKNKNLYELMRICDLVITVTSTIILEATLIGKPIISFNPNPEPDVSYLKRYNIAFVATTKKELFEYVYNLLYNLETIKTFKKFQRYIIPGLIRNLDGKATDRVVQLILSLLDTRCK